MPREFHRSQRLGEQIQRLLSDLIHSELRDPRINSLVTITSVDLSRDLSHANVWFSSMEPEADMEAIGKALAGAAGFLRRGLGRQVSARTVPQLHFRHDQSIDEGMRMDELIDSAVADDASRRHEDD